MQQKIIKLFSFFSDIKNQPFYSSCIFQIIQTYQSSQQSLKLILFNLNLLIFSPCKQIRLRLKHRQICSSIISKLNRLYCQRVKSFIDDKNSFDLESFQIQEGKDKVEDRRGFGMWEDMDVFKIIQDEKLLLATEKGRNQLDKQNVTEEEQKRIFDQFVDIKHATMLNMEDLFKDFDEENELMNKAYEEKRTKYSKKAEKYKEKNIEKQVKQIQLTISNPFNLMFQICVQNMLHSEWELRHLSVLILKELLLYSEFLGFSHTFSMRKMNSVQQRFQFLSMTTKQALIEHFKSNQKKKKIFNQSISNSIVLLCLDRFADYQTDQSLIIVRVIAAQILRISFPTLTSQQQSKLLKLIKRIFLKQSATFYNIQNAYSKIKFTWQVKHSFLYFLVLLTEDPTYYSMVFKYFQEPFIKMLGNTQIDQVILCICKIFNRFVGQKFFEQKAIDRVNQQIWVIIQTLDDISISTKQTLSLLGIMFPHFKSSQSVCLERIKKFFTSKINQVRMEFYHVLNLLYKRDWKIPQKCKIIQQNMVQLLQASVIQHQTQLFQKVLQLAPNLLRFCIKDKKLRKISQFIQTCILTCQPSSVLIKKHFKQFSGPKQEKISNQSQYLYFYQQDKIGIPNNVYMEKRIYKISRLLILGFRQNMDGLQQCLRAIQKAQQTNTSRYLLIYLVLNNLITPQAKKNKFFIEYSTKAQEFLKLESYSQVFDPQINLYITEFQNLFAKLVPKLNTPQFDKIYENFKQTKLNSKDNADLDKNLLQIYASYGQGQLKNQLKYFISVLQTIIQNQTQLLKRLKLLCSNYLIKYCLPQQPVCLNLLIKSFSQCLKRDSYLYISQVCSETAYLLSSYLHKKKKAIYSKLNLNLVQKTQIGYRMDRLKLREKDNTIKMESQPMMAIKGYVRSIGLEVKDWIEEFGDLFVKDINIEQNQDNLLKLNMLTGNLISLHQIDHKLTFLPKLMSLISTLTKNPIFDTEVDETDNQKIVKQILNKSFLHFCKNYNANSNIFFQWYMNQLKLLNRAFYKTLQVISHQHLVQISAICSLFIMRVVKSISLSKIQDLSMNSLSNLIVGVYTNNVILEFSAVLQQYSSQGIQFIKNFKDTSKFNYQIKVKLSQQIQLRNYQIEGITWLGFLTRYNLNGALCDDMGLGKTLQILILIQNQYHKLLQHNLNAKKEDKQSVQNTLIVVPTTLVEHWAFEYKKYFKNCICKVITIGQKNQIRQSLSELSKGSKKPIILITNYNIIQKQIQSLSGFHFKFIILDQGHIIKNVKTNKFKAIKRLQSSHRFILTGTPIQNRLKQLWGLFDFLMPGYLYNQELFRKHYDKLFQVNLTTFKEDQLMFTQGQKKILQKLHFKVMPFVMRRLKSEVLRQLPSKIINDYYCQLTDVQQTLYKKFEDQQCHKIDFGQQKNVLTTLMQMRKILNHPNQLQSSLKRYKWDDSGKYIALSQLFQQLGFSQPLSLLQNKAIIFSRFNITIQLLQKQFLLANFPHIKYLKLTGSTKIGQRFQIAQTFNGDSDIRVLLVTTQVGGEGLNLSSANVVIMFDHDYNPTVDMQAIDRAHRIGQKRVLNVYRLITKDTLEQRIMGIQKFKTNLANAIVNIDNASIKNIKESNLPELLENVRDIQTNNKQVQSSVNKSMYKQMIKQLQRNSIDTDEFMKKY